MNESLRKFRGGKNSIIVRHFQLFAFRKSACMRVGPRVNVNCSNIVASDGRELSWCENIRYLGIYVKAARQYSYFYYLHFS